MSTSVLFYRGVETSAVAILLLVGVLAFGGGTLASSSPPPKVALSGLLLQTASPEQLEALSTGLAPGLKIGTAHAIKSTRHDRAWYVGVHLKRAGKAEEIAVWLVTGSKTAPQHLYSVDREAQDASAWPTGSVHRVSTSSVDQEALALRSALRSR